MSILIKGISMPATCCECFANFHDVCQITGACLTFDEQYVNGAASCPLIEVPTPHGRLIDADLLMREFEKAQNTMQQHGQEYSCSFLSTSREISTEWYCVEDILDNAPTVIEAEG